MATQSQSKSAIVIGGSMAGLLAARVLADSFTSVTICERDHISGINTARKGVPQGNHAHALLPKGQEILKELFPGIVETLVAEGAPVGFGRFFIGGGWLARFDEKGEALFVSRPRLEAEVRARVLALPNVNLCEECDVLGFVTAESGQRISGVRVIARQAGSSEEIRAADLVVDASGRGSRTPAWLEALGYAKPEVELVQVDMAYATRVYERKPEHFGGDLIANIAPTPENPRGSGTMAQEGNRWIVTVAGYFGDKPPTDSQGFLEFARGLPAPDVYDMIRNATPLSDPLAYHFPANQRRHYEKLSRFPEGLLVMGDAVCSFTPIYGQGMTVSALEAMALREHLRTGSPARDFFQRISKIAAVAWLIAAGSDEKLKRTAQPANAIARLVDRYMERLVSAAHTDRAVALAFMQFSGLLTGPASLFNPAIVWRVLRAGAPTADGRRQTADGGRQTAANLTQ